MSKRTEHRDCIFNTMVDKSLHGHYSDRLEAMADVLDDSETINNLLAVKQLYNSFGCKPHGIDGVLTMISNRIYYQCEKIGFTKKHFTELRHAFMYQTMDMHKIPYPETTSDTELANC